MVILDDINIKVNKRNHGFANQEFVFFYVENFGFDFYDDYQKCFPEYQEK